MPKISQQKIQKIQEQILFYLFSKFPRAFFTSDIAKEIARDEEFTKKLLINLQKNNFVIKINKNSEGKDYLKRSRWRISNRTYDLYSKYQK